MSHFAEISGSFEATRSVVLRVIRAEQDFINSGAVGDSHNWIQCSYNTHGGVHPSGSGFRKNFPGAPKVEDPPGISQDFVWQSWEDMEPYLKYWTYDKTRDAFISPEPFPSWILNEDTCRWESPVSASSDEIANGYVWDEDTTSWVDSRET